MRLHSSEQAGPARPSVAFVVLGACALDTLLGMETGTQAENQVPSPGKVERFCCSEVRLRVKSWPDHLAAMEL